MEKIEQACGSGRIGATTEDGPAQSWELQADPPSNRLHRKGACRASYARTLRLGIITRRVDTRWRVMARIRRPHRPKVRPEKLARIRLAVYERDGYRCQHCGWQPSVPDGYDGSGALCGRVTPTGRRRAWLRVLQLDHIVPYKLGGRFELSNLQALCDLCNVRKGAAIA